MTQIIANRYLLQEKLGVGGMGEVYRAYDRLTGQTIALKRVLVAAEQLLFQSHTGEINLRVALAREFQTLASLRHPNIISVLDYGFDDDHQPFFTMTLLENAVTIRRAAQRCDLQGKAELLVQVLQALAYLHRRNIIHRDLKPANVLVDTLGQVKLLDFGLAVEENFTREISGTLEYMAPEVLESKGATFASDLYAVGVMAYDLLADKYPFNNHNVMELIEDIVHKPVNYEPFLRAVDAQYNEQLVAFLQQLLAKDPAERPQSAAQVMHELGSILNLPLNMESADIRESFLQSARFVGRETELNTLMDALQETINGTGRAWLIGGESGVGKSRLLEELRTQALVRGAMVFNGQGVEGGGLPYQLWHEVARRLIFTTPPTDLQAGILRELVPDIDALLEREIPEPPKLMGPPSRQRLAHTIADLFPQKPIVLILEDLHWTDESLIPLNTLLMRLSTLPLLIVGSYRDDERPNLPGELPAMQVMKLGRLSDDAIAILCTSMIGDAVERSQVLELIQRESEGNTYFIVEVVRALAEEAGSMADIGERTLPPKVFTGGVTQIVQRRLGRVPAWGQAWLKLAAIYGRQLDLEVLRYLSNMTTELRRHTLDEWLEVCNNAAVLEVYDNQWRFTHDKLREGVLQQVNKDERQVSHRMIAEAIEAVYPYAVAQQEILMEHWRLAGNTAKELDYILPVTERWVEYRAAYRAACVSLERALRLLDEDDPRTLTVLNRLGESYFHIGNYDASEKAVRNAHTIAERTQNIPELMLALYGLGMVAQRKGEHQNAHGFYQRSLDYAQQMGEKHGASYTLTALGVLHWYEGNFKQSEEYLTRSLAVQIEIGDNRGMVRVYYHFGLSAFRQGDYARAKDYFEQALVTAEKIGHRIEIAQNLYAIADVYTQWREYARANDYYTRALHIYEEIGDKRSIAKSLNGLGALAEYENKFPVAQDYYEKSLAITRALGDPYGISVNLSSLGDLMERTRDYVTARHYYEQSLELRRNINERNGIAENLNGISRTTLILNPNAAVSESLREAISLSHEIGSIPMLLASLVTTARWLLRHHLPDLALQCCALVHHHPGTEGKVRSEVSTLFPALEDALDRDNLHADLELGKSLDLNVFVDGLLQTLASGQAN